MPYSPQSQTLKPTKYPRKARDSRSGLLRARNSDEGNIRLLKQVHSLVNLSKKNGPAWQGETLALACSSEIDIRYFLTEGWAAGLPGDKRDQSPVQPMELRIARSFPIVLLTVPAASLVGQQHFRLEWEPKLGS